MPWQVKKKDGKWVVVKEGTDEVVAGKDKELTREEAMAAMRARYANTDDTK